MVDVYIEYQTWIRTIPADIAGKVVLKNISKITHRQCWNIEPINILFGKGEVWR